MESHEFVSPLGKRKAASTSPERESRGQAAMVNDRKRRDTEGPGDVATIAGEDGMLAKPLNDIENSDEDDEEHEAGEGNESHEATDEGDEEDEEAEMYGSGFEEEDEDDTYGFGFGDYSDEEDQGPPEREVERQEESFDDKQFTFKIFLAEDDDEFISWMSTIHVQCTYNEEIIGRAYGRYVNRDRIRPTFWCDMEEPCQELSSVAFSVFDRYGRLKKEFKDHPVRKGSGAWGSELDIGDIFVIEYIIINKEWRRRGIGRRIAHHLLEKARKGGRTLSFSLVVPGWLTSDIESDLKGRTKLEQRVIRFSAANVASTFWRSLGFRSIGASGCLGFPEDASHVTHKILAKDDFEPATEDPELDEGPEHELVADWNVEPAKKSWRLALLKDQLPLHHAALTLSDSECVDFFTSFKNSDRPSDEWVKIDRAGKNVLHMAAAEAKPQSIRWLLDNSRHGETLLAARAVDGNTPLEYLESELETKRTRQERGMMTLDISDNFTGFSAEAIDCLAALRGMKQPTPIERARLKFGCTCGSCIDGFLSPRMKFALLCQAEVLHDMLDDDIADGKMWCMMHDDLFTYVAPDIQQNLLTNKSYRQGFANLFDHAAVALRGNTSITPLNVLMAYEKASEWPPHTRNFLQRGGTVESAIRIIFDHSHDQDEWTGDGYHMEVFEEQINEMPECRNDQEFGVASLACGIPYERSSMAPGRRLPFLGGNVFFRANDELH